MYRLFLQASLGWKSPGMASNIGVGLTVAGLVVTIAGGPVSIGIALGIFGILIYLSEGVMVSNSF